jgi:hypothetical protein
MSPDTSLESSHAKLSPSGSYRRINCPGSLLKEEPYPNSTNQWSEQGSSAHALAEATLRAGLLEVPDHLLGVDHRDPKDITIEFKADDDMAEAVDVYLEDIKYILRDAGNELNPGFMSPLILIEQKLHMPGIHPTLAWGTGDFVTYWPDKKRVIVRDYKNGRGLVEVEIDDENPEIKFNTQLMEYGYGAIVHFRNLKFEVEEVDMGIVQPNASHRDGPCRSVIVPAQEVMNFIYGIDKTTAEEALAPGGRIIAGSWCKYCLHERDCTEKTGKALTDIQDGFGPVDILDTTRPITLDLPSLAGMSGPQLGNMSDLLNILKAYNTLVEDEILARLSLEGVVPGWVLKKSKPHRKWKDEAEGTLSMSYGDDDIYEPRKLKTPAKMEKKLGRKSKDEIEGLITRPEGTLSIGRLKETKKAATHNQDTAEGFSAAKE